MSRPTTKQELLTAADGQFAKLWWMIDLMTLEERSAPF